MVLRIARDTGECDDIFKGGVNEKPKTKTQSEREKAKAFLWHFKHPEFSRDRWWENSGKPLKEVTQDAVLWELLRRNPRTEKWLSATREDYGKIRFPVEVSLSYWGCRPWNKLTDRNKRFWNSNINNCVVAQHGIAAVPITAVRTLCNPAARSDPSREVRDVAMSQKDFGAFQEALRLYECRNLGHLFFDAIVKGRAIVSVDLSIPGIEHTVKEAVERLASEYWLRFREGRFPDFGQAHVSDWLNTVSEFEKIVESGGKQDTPKKAGIAKQYRCLVERFWPA